MKPPSDITAPIPVLHLTLDAQPEVLPPAPGFSIYWRDDVPVGAVKAFNADVSLADCTPLRENIAPLSGEPLPASVIICTRDRPDQLARCLLSLKNQTLAPTEI